MACGRVDLGEMHAQGDTGEASGVLIGKRDVAYQPNERREVEMGELLQPFCDFASVFGRGRPTDTREEYGLVRWSR